MASLGARDPALDIPVAFLLLRGLARDRPAHAIDRALARVVADLLATQSYEALAATRELAGYRELHARFGKTGRQYLAAPESLFKLLFKRGAWRAVDPLIDAYTLISLQTRVSIGAHDAQRLRLPLRLQPTVGGERVLLIGEANPSVLTANEYGYRDADGQLLGRMACRQAEATKVTADTRDVIFILQGHATLDAQQLRMTADKLAQAVVDWVGIGAEAPALEVLP